jgi:transposase InsO family protein
MRSVGLAGVRLRRKHRTTVADPTAAKAPDLVRRDFAANEPNTKYVGDITYLPLDGGKFLYLATVTDLASRRLAGWAIADHMRTDLVIDALAAAERTRGSLPERSCTPTTAPRTAAGPSPTPATRPASPSP